MTYQRPPKPSRCRRGGRCAATSTIRCARARRARRSRPSASCRSRAQPPRGPARRHLPPPRAHVRPRGLPNAGAGLARTAAVGGDRSRGGFGGRRRSAASDVRSRTRRRADFGASEPTLRASFGARRAGTDARFGERSTSPPGCQASRHSASRHEHSAPVTATTRRGRRGPRPRSPRWSSSARRGPSCSARPLEHAEQRISARGVRRPVIARAA